MTTALPAKPLYSVVIPVYNSEGVVAATVARTIEFFEKRGLPHEIILVNDGSTDNSWEVIKQLAQGHDRVISINLLKNYGQHNANMCGFRVASGDWVITMDDDLQNPPEEIEKLIKKSEEGYELVVGRFLQKRHAFYRRLGSKLINRVNRNIFSVPEGIALSNFRLISRSIIDRICSYRTSYPYVPGLVIMFAHNVANIEVEHHAREYAQSNYDLPRILKLVATILFAYSSYPLRIVSLLGMLVAAISFMLGGFFLFRGLFVGVSVSGWVTIVCLISFFSAIIMAMLGMIGEYLVRLINQTSNADSYVIKEIIKVNDG